MTFLPLRRIAPRHAAQYAAASAALCLCAAVALAFLLPLAAALLPAIRTPDTGAADSGGTMAILKTVRYTLAEALVSTALAAAAGLAAAFFVARRQFPGRKLLASFASVPLCIPPLIMALGYISAFGMAGYLNKALQHIFRLQEAPLTFLYSFWGIVIVQGFYNFPLVMMTVADTWAQLGSDQADSARILGASERRIFLTVTLPQLLPAIISACIPVFLYCFFSFMIVLLFGATGGTTLEVAIYHAGRSTLHFRTAAQLALVETACAFCVLLAYASAEKKAARAKGLSFCGTEPRKRIQAAEGLPSLGCLLLLGLFFLLPLISIALSSCRIAVWRRLLAMRGFFPALRNTMCTALLTASICTITGFSYAAFLRLRDPSGEHPLLKTIPLAPMAVSSVVMGIGMTALVRRGNVASLVLAQSALTWPFAFRQMYTPLSKIPQDTLDAARMLSPRRLDCVFSVLLPYGRSGILSAAGFCFAVSAGDASLPLVLAIPRFDTLSLFVYRLAGSYRVDEACAAGLLLGILCMAVFNVSNRLKERRLR